MLLVCVTFDHSILSGSEWRDRQFSNEAIIVLLRHSEFLASVRRLEQNRCGGA